MRPPDLKQLLLAHLAARLDVPVVSTRPDGDSRPARFVRIIGTGGAGLHDRLAYTVQVTVDSYAESPGRAAALAADVDEIMRALPASPLPVTSVTGTAPQESPDSDTAQARATATYQLPTILN